jgi:hypothetical protein
MHNALFIEPFEANAVVCGSGWDTLLERMAMVKNVAQCGVNCG